MTFAESRDWVLTKIDEFGYAYDHAIPQAFMEKVRDHTDDMDVRFVWVYPPAFLFGLPAPLTHAAREWCEAHGESYWDGLVSEEVLRIRSAN